MLILKLDYNEEILFAEKYFATVADSAGHLLSALVGRCCAVYQPQLCHHVPIPVRIATEHDCCVSTLLHPLFHPSYHVLKGAGCVACGIIVG